MNVPRIMIAAPNSGSGKTLVTCALLGALKEQQVDVVSCKCGPDYIDPLFHRLMLEIPTENLDTFFTDERQTRSLLADFADSHEMVVMEGVMGLYDGLGGTGKEGSAYHLACVTKTPVILVVDVHGMGRSMIPLIAGFLAYDKEHIIRGIILNRITKKFYETMKPLIAQELAVPVLGCLEYHKDLQLESRHLGLTLPSETNGIREKLMTAAHYLQETVDLDEIIAIAGRTEELPSENKAEEPMDSSSETVTLAVARDEAFCFYYEANLRMFEQAGVQLSYFSPIHDKKLPEPMHGILLGGGYPELYAEALSQNQDMIMAIRSALSGGIPSLAECGGFMYLHRELKDENGTVYPLVNAIDDMVFYTGRSVRFGYVELEECQAEFLEENAVIKGHEFHYYDSTGNGEDCRAVKPVMGQQWQCCHKGKNHWWGFPHLYYPSCPQFVRHFIQQMEEYKNLSHPS